MAKQVSVSGLALCWTIVAAWPLPVRQASVQAQPAGGGARRITFDDKGALTGWSVTGDVATDPARGRGGHGAALKVGPGGKAVWTLRDKDESGKVEVWVYDDGAVPRDPKAHRAGPRWGLVHGDGRVLAAGMLYANYLGGAEGYTATACDGKEWFDKLFWLGVRRAPAGWRKWTFDFDPDAGLRVLHNDKEVSAVDSRKVGLKGFRAFAVWGDSGKDAGQTIWLDDLSVTLGGPANVPPTIEADPYEEKAVAADRAANRPVPVHTRDNAPPTPTLEDLARKDSVSQYGITWTFQKPARVGRFVNGDWYVVGPATVTAIAPKPLYGKDVPPRELDRMDKERKVEHRVRNGFMLNPPAERKVAYDSEDDTAFIQTIKEATGKDYDREWSRHGWAWQEKEAFVKEMWAKHRAGPGMPPTDGWKRQHDDSYYRAAVEKSK